MKSRVYPLEPTLVHRLHVSLIFFIDLSFHKIAYFISPLKEPALGLVAILFYFFALSLISAFLFTSFFSVFIPPFFQLHD